MTTTVESAAVLTPPGLVLRPYQTEAVDAIADRLASGGRTQLWAACGSGKALIGLAATERLLPTRGTAVVLCPSLTLVAQILSVYARTGGDFHAVAVCSDAGVADSFVHARDLPCPVTTDPAEIAGWLRAHTARRRLIVGTHQAADRLAAGLAQAGHTVDLLIVDEAHHLAGRGSKHSALVHQDQRLPARARLYMTATPRLLTAGRVNNRALDEDETSVSMDDTDVFGPVAYSYPFSRAIAEGYLDDYRLAVIGVTRPDVLAMLRRTDPDAVLDPRSPTVRTSMVHAALARAARRWRLRRVLAFCPRVADAAEFARGLPATLGQLDPGARPAGPVYAGHVSGEMSVRQRELVLRHLLTPPRGGWTVISNARCLSEGVDIPAVDGVVFAHAKRSTVDIVQAVGRALRHDPGGSGTATVLVPILLPDDPHALTDVGAPGEFDALWQVVRALRAHDDTLAAELDVQRGEAARGPVELPSRIQILLPADYDHGTFLDYLTVRLVRSATSSWWEGLAAAQAYHADRGDLDVSSAYRTARRFELGAWIAQQRLYRKRGWLPADRIEALDKLGLRWTVFEERFAANLEAARAFHREHGHLNIPQDHGAPGHPRLGMWLTQQRQNHRKGLLPADRVAALTDCDPLWAQPRLSEGLAAARAYHARTGHLTMPAAYRENGVRLSAWLTERRKEHRAGTVHPHVRAVLSELGMTWGTHLSRWDRGLNAARAFHARTGHLEVPSGHREHEVNLSDWLQNRRRERRAGTLAPERVAALEELGMIWDPYAQDWRRGLAAATAFRARTGHLTPGRGHWELGVQLSAWLVKQRKDYRSGTLAMDRVLALEQLGIVWDPRAQR